MEPTEMVAVRSESTVRPEVDPEVSVEPDGTISLYWAWADHRHAFLLTFDQARDLTGKLIAATMIGPRP